MTNNQAQSNYGAAYFILLVLYELKTFFFLISPVITVGLTFIVILANIYYIFLVNFSYKTPPLFKGLNIFLLLLVIYGLILIISGKQLSIQEMGVPVNTTAFLIKSITSLGPIYAFYDIGMRGGLKQSRIVKWFYILIFIAIVLFVQNRAELIAGGKNASEVTNNMSYMFVALIPFLFLLEGKRVLQYLLLAFFVAMIVTSVKRGAMIVTAAALLIFFILSIKESKKKNRFWLYLLTIVFLVAGAYLTMRYFNTNDFLQYRYQRTVEGDSSFRDVIYADLWFHFINDADMMRQIFGYGAWATLDISVNFAHQDWLELLTDMGLLGVASYLYFWVCFGVTIKRCRKQGLFVSFSILLIVFVIYFSRSLFSMSFESFGLLPGICIGYSLSSYSRVILISSQK